MNSILIYTVHKAASMFLHRLNLRIAREYGIACRSINLPRDMKLIRATSWLDVIEAADSTSCFGPIRAGECVPNIPADLRRYRVILHLRDPRDALTSLYYSHVYSHRRTPGVFNPSDDERAAWERGGIDAFVLSKAPQVLELYQTLCSRLLGREQVQLVTYERLVTDYAGWLAGYLSAFDHIEPPPRRILGLVPRPNSQARIARRLERRFCREFTPVAEDVRAHRRQVAPGDHRRKLAAATIAELDGMFADVLGILARH